MISARPQRSALEVRWKILTGATAVGVMATIAVLALRPAEPPVPAAVATTSAAKPGAPADGPDAASLAPAEQKLPGAWVDQAPPKADPNRPLVLGLHGRGDSAGNFAAIAGRLGPDLTWRFLEAPLPWRENTQWFRMDAPDGGRSDLEQAAQLVEAHVRSAKNRKVALVGFSQGCFLAAHYAATRPDSVAAVLCIGGGLVYPPEVPASRHKPAILFVHGLEDRVIPTARGRDARQVLENRGLPSEWLEHAEGHVVPESEVGRMRAWLESHLR